MLEEEDDIETTKRYLEIGYKRVKESLRKIQLDYSKILKMKGIPLKNCCHSSDSIFQFKNFKKKEPKRSKNSYTLGISRLNEGRFLSL